LSQFASFARILSHNIAPFCIGKNRRPTGHRLFSAFLDSKVGNTGSWFAYSPCRRASGFVGCRSNQALGEQLRRGAVQTRRAVGSRRQRLDRRPACSPTAVPRVL